MAKLKLEFGESFLEFPEEASLTVVCKVIYFLKWKRHLYPFPFFDSNIHNTSIHFQVDGVAGARQPRGVEQHRGARGGDGRVSRSSSFTRTRSGPNSDSKTGNRIRP